MKKLLFLILSLSFVFASCKNTSEGGNNTLDLKKHNVAFTVDGGNGRLKAKVEGNATEYTDGTTGINIEKGKKVIFTATPDKDYVVESWFNGTTNVTAQATNEGKKYELTVNKAVEIKVKFKKNEVTPPPNPQTVRLKFSVEGEGGTLSARIKNAAEDLIASSDGIVSVESGKTVVFTAKPDDDFEVEKWIKDENDVLDNKTNTYELTLIADVSIKVKFSTITHVNGSYDDATGKGKVGDAIFTMKKIDEAPEAWLGYEREKHKVSLSSYWIGETEVTQKLWQEVMKENPSFFDNTGSKNYNGISYETAPHGDEIQENRPVEQIIWFDAIVFCNELTKQIGLGINECVYYSDQECTKVYTKNDAKLESPVFIYKTPKNSKNMSDEMNKKGFRLPTEAEWEWASMGGNNQSWSGTSEETEVTNFAWLDANSNKRTHEVRKKNPNAYGLYDMTGNVMECCWDWHGAITKDSDLGKNPIGAISGTEKTVRGGSFVIAMQFLAENKMRGKLSTKLPQRYLGMRLVKGN